MIICGTGHRPNKVGGYSKEAFDNLTSLAHMYLCAGRPASKVISGMALGWDQALAKAAIDLGIPLVAAVPFAGQQQAWPESSREFFDYLLGKAVEIVIVSDGGYAPWKMQIRNAWMVDHSDMVLALWDGSEGGTHNCITYAKSKNKPIVNLWEMYDSAARG